MSNNGTNAREEPWQLEEEQSSESSFLASLFLENNDGGLDDICSNHFQFPNPPLSISSHYPQQEGPSNTSMAHIIPPRSGEVENAFETQQPSLFMEPGLNQFRNVDQEPHYAGLSKVSMPAAQGNGNSLGSSSYHVSVMEPNSQSSLVSGIGAPSQSFPATQHANNTNLQPQKSQVSTERGKNVANDKEKPQFQELLSQYYPLAVPLNPQNQLQSTEGQGLLGTNPTRKQLRIGDSSASSSRNVRMRTTLVDNNQQSTPIRVDNSLSTMHGNRQQFAPTEMENPPAPLLNNNQQLASAQVGNFHNPFAVPENRKQMPLHGGNSFINQPTLRNNNPQVAPIRMENSPTHSLNNNQQMASHSFDNFLNPSPMIDNGQPVALPWVDNSSPLLNNNQELSPIRVDNLHNQPAQGTENPPTPPTPPTPIPRYRENGLYSQVYEQMGYFADPILRMFLASKQKRGGM